MRSAPAHRVLTVEAAASNRQKSLGAFYTPPEMAERMVEWAVRTPTDRALDPSFGGLVFLAAAHARLATLGAGEPGGYLYGCDLDEDAHAAAEAHVSLHVPVEALVESDFFELAPGVDLPLVEAVVGNPPYVRYQLHNGSGAAGRRVAKKAGLALTRLASSWAPFVLHSADFVAPGGRLALVLPAELLHAQYAGEVLAWVQRRFARTALVVFEQRVFPGALEEVVLLFAEGRGEGTSESVSLVECDTLAELDLDVLRKRLAAARPAEKSQGKLLAQLLPQATQELYARLAYDERVQPLGARGAVDIGAVTGANDFFLLAAGEQPNMAEELVRPAVSKAAHVRGAQFVESDYERLVQAGARCRFFIARADTSKELLASAHPYLQRGEREGIDKRYKCRVRKPWWAVPLPKRGAPDLFLTYCAAEFPRLVYNAAGALHTNTLHGVKLSDGTSARALAACFYNSLTLLSAELVGRSYGGGVLKLEPTEAEALLIPPVFDGAAEKLGEVDGLVRAGELGAVLNLVDGLLLREGLGLSDAEVGRLRAGAERLRARRRARGKNPMLALRHLAEGVAHA